MKKIFTTNHLNTIVGCVLGGITIFLMLSSAKSDRDRRCPEVIVKLDGNSEQLLVKESDVEKWATIDGRQPVKGKLIHSIDLKTIEDRVEKSGMVKSCEAFFDLKGNLILDTKVWMPVARILGTRVDRYLDKTGQVFPKADNFTPTVLLISGDFFSKRKSLQSDKNKDLLDFINLITSDPFWNAQITQLDINSAKDIKIVPMYGDNTVEFGKPENVDLKLKNLKAYYKYILPQEQWGHFREVSVKYDGQIVCK